MIPLSAPDLSLLEIVALGRPARRVLHLINGEHYAGAERVQDLLAGRLGEFGFEVGFACLKPGSFAEARTARGAPIHDLPMRCKLDLSPIWKLARLLRDEHYDLLNTHTVRGALIGRLAARWAGVPMVHHVHSPASAESTHRLRNRLNARVERWALKKAAALIGVSHAMGAHAVAQGFDPRRVCVVHNGVPATRPPTTRDAWRDGPRDHWTIGTIALFRPRKGIETLLRAFAKLRDQHLPVRLRAVGKFETPVYRREIDALVDELRLADAIDWTGFTNDVHRELTQMDLFVLPSLFGEGLPMVILEAMAAGVPVVATRVGGASEAIRDGLDGLLAIPGDADDLACLMQRVLSDRASWSAIRHSAHERQTKRFSDRSMAEGVAGVYRRVLAEQKRSRLFGSVAATKSHDPFVPVSLIAGSFFAGPFFTDLVETDRRLRVLGVDICDVTMQRAVEKVEAMIDRRKNGCQAVYFVNAHTLNLACSQPDFRDLLNQADTVFGDGTGVRWAARLQGVRLKDNVNGTDLMPATFGALDGRGYSYFLLGSDEASVVGAAEKIRQAFPGWSHVGYHHGYLAGGDLDEQVIEKINAAHPDVLLVGMGNPIQERWIDQHRHRLPASVALGVGGLIDYWSGKNYRAPLWLRRCGCEWIGVLLLQPRKARRYLLGNPLFLARILRQWWRERRRR